MITLYSSEITLCRRGCKIGKNCNHIDKYQCLDNECKKIWDSEIKSMKYKCYSEDSIKLLLILKKFTYLFDTYNHFPNEIIYFILDIFIDNLIILKIDMIKHCQTKEVCHNFFYPNEDGAKCKKCEIDVCTPCARKWLSVKNLHNSLECNECMFLDL